MKRLLLILSLLTASISSFAQIKLVEVNNEADTLLYSTRALEGDIIELYKNQLGYMILINTDNSLDLNFKFYIGKTKSDALTSLNCLNSLIDSDVASTSTIEDVNGTTFETRTAYMALTKRRPTYTKSDRLLIRNPLQAGWMTMKPKGISEIIEFLSK